MYENREEPVLDLPVPGIGMTAELGGRPWQQPAQYTTVDEVAQYYIAQMQDEAFTEQTLNLLETKMPVTMIANAMQTTGVMNGLHTIDVGILTLPIIMEMIMFIADSDGIDYVTGIERDVDAEVRDSSIQLAVEQAQQEQPIEDEQMVESEPTLEDDVPTGLMARRV